MDQKTEIMVEYVVRKVMGAGRAGEEDHRFYNVQLAMYDRGECEQYQRSPCCDFGNALIGLVDLLHTHSGRIETSKTGLSFRGLSYVEERTLRQLVDMVGK